MIPFYSSLYCSSVCMKISFVRRSNRKVCFHFYHYHWYYNSPNQQGDFCFKEFAINGSTLLTINIHTGSLTYLKQNKRKLTFSLCLYFTWHWEDNPFHPLSNYFSLNLLTSGLHPFSSDHVKVTNSRSKSYTLFKL